MRIISDFKDYYDYGMAFGQDTTIVYSRKTEDVNLYNDSGFSYNPKIAPWLTTNKLRNLMKNTRHMYMRGDRITLTTGYLFVAGRVYPYAKVYSDNYPHESTEQYCYSIEDLQNCVKLESSSWLYRSYLEAFFAYKIVNQDGTYETIDPEFMVEDCLENNVPIFSMSGQVSTIGECRYFFSKDVCLKDRQFGTMLDSVSLYQELEMFLGLVKTRQPTPAADNNTKILGHGFDLKQSFRHRK